MSNKEMYDQAVANGMEFTYFHGEDIVPDDFEDSIKETFWDLERDSAERNYDNTSSVFEYYNRDIEHDISMPDDEKRIPKFILESDRSDAAKATAYDCYANLRYDSNGFGTINENGDSMNIPYNDNRGFDLYFLGH